jgi:hypothetical protein
MKIRILIAVIALFTAMLSALPAAADGPNKGSEQTESAIVTESAVELQGKIDGKAIGKGVVAPLNEAPAARIEADHASVSHTVGLKAEGTESIEAAQVTWNGTTNLYRQIGGFPYLKRNVQTRGTTTSTRAEYYMYVANYAVRNGVSTAWSSGAAYWISSITRGWNFTNVFASNYYSRSRHYIKPCGACGAWDVYSWRSITLY